MSKISSKKVLFVGTKKTRQGSGRWSKTPAKGGEVFYGCQRTGSPPSKFRRRRKPGRGQGK